MRQKGNWLKILFFILIAAAVFGTGYMMGNNTALSAAAAATVQYQAEKELDIILNRSELEGLGEIEGTVYVTGHKSPDSDTVCSSIAYAALLKELGIDAQAVTLGNINRESAYILESAGVEVPPVMTDASGKTFILVDHSEYSHSADGLEDANVISIIDHHGDGSVTTSNPLIYDARPVGSTATIVWIRYRNYGVEIDPQIALVLLGAVLSDTTDLHSSTTTTADREAVRVLGAIAGVENTELFAQELYKKRISHEGMTDEEIFFNDYKEYECAGTKFSIGCINVYDEAEARDMAQSMKALLGSTLASTGMDMAFAQISIFHDDISVTFLVPSDEAAAEVLKMAFGEQAVFDGISYVLSPGVSRKQVLVPAISDILAMHPGE